MKSKELQFIALREMISLISGVNSNKIGDKLLVLGIRNVDDFVRMLDEAMRD